MPSALATELYEDISQCMDWQGDISYSDVARVSVSLASELGTAVDGPRLLEELEVVEWIFPHVRGWRVLLPLRHVRASTRLQR